MPATARKPKPAAQRSARWMHPDPLAAFANDELVCLALWDGNRGDVYEIEPVIRAGSFECWLMRKIEQDGELHEYRVAADFASCNCPHSVYRPNAKPCRHRAGLKAALERLYQ